MKLAAATRLKSTAPKPLTKKQRQLDVNGDGRIDADDLKRLRKGEKPVVAANQHEFSGTELVAFAETLGISGKIRRGVSSNWCLMISRPDFNRALSRLRRYGCEVDDQQADDGWVSFTGTVKGQPVQGQFSLDLFTDGDCALTVSEV